MRAPPPPAIVSKAPIYRPLVILSTLDLPSMLWGRPRAAQQPTGSGLQFWPVPVPPPRVPVVDDRTQEAQLVGAGARAAAPSQLQPLPPAHSRLPCSSQAFASARDRAQGQEACEAKVLKGCTAGLRSVARPPPPLELPTRCFSCGRPRHPAAPHPHTSLTPHASTHPPQGRVQCAGGAAVRPAAPAPSAGPDAGAGVGGARGVRGTVHGRLPGAAHAGLPAAR